MDSSPEGKADHEKIVFLTQQAYSRNLAPVGVGQKVGILVSSEEPTLSSVRFCFRVIRQDGAPVCCGFQTMVCLSKATGNVVAAPPSVARGSNLMKEKLQAPSFADRVLAGHLKQVFDEATVAIGGRGGQCEPRTTPTPASSEGRPRARRPRGARTP